VPKINLTDITVRKLRPPPAGQITYWDSTLTGFGLRVSQGGAKTFTVVHGARRERLTIGRYPIISLAEARTAARRILAERTLGAHRSPSINFDEALKQFFSTHCDQNNRVSTATETKRLLSKHFLPGFRKEAVGDITPHDISKRIDRLLATPSEANHAFTAIRSFFRWATRRHYVRHNPCEGMQIPTRAVARDRVLTDQELAQIYKTATQLGYPFGTIVQLLILTGQRRGEIGSMRWGYIEERTVSLPSSLTKNNREHVFPLGETAASILERVPRFNSPYLFPARGRDTPFNGWSKCKAAFDRTCSVGSWTLHDLRRTFATNLAALGIPVQVTEKLLNHASGTTAGIVAVYQRHTYMDEMRAAIELWEHRLLGLLAR